MKQFIISEEDANRLLFHFTKTPHVYEEIHQYVQILFGLKPLQDEDGEDIEMGGESSNAGEDAPEPESASTSSGLPVVDAITKKKK